MHSRDELRSRSPEIAPSWHEIGDGSRANYPVDPDAGGTWVAVHENGFYLGLLNLNLPDHELDADRPIASRSRGLLIPELIQAGCVEDAIAMIENMDLAGTSPFRLIVAGRGQGGRYVYAAKQFRGVWLSDVQQITELDRPVCFASSGLGDSLVQCRLPVFDEMMALEATIENQHAFHQHQWADRTEFSVMMSRPDARTSSVTSVVAAGEKEPKILYERFTIGDPVCDPVGAGMLR